MGGNAILNIIIICAIFFTAFCDRGAGGKHDVLFETTAVHGERTELIYLGLTASFSGIPR